MTGRVGSALSAIKGATKTSQNNSRVEVALANTKQFVQNNIGAIIGSIEKDYSAAMDAYNNFVYDKSNDQTLNAINTNNSSLSDIRRRLKAYRAYLDADAVDGMLSSLDTMGQSYDAYRSQLEEVSAAEKTARSKRAVYEEAKKAIPHGENIVQTALNLLGGVGERTKDYSKKEYEKAATEYASLKYGSREAVEKRIAELSEMDELHFAGLNENYVKNVSEDMQKNHEEGKKIQAEIDILKTALNGKYTIGEHIGAQVKAGATQLYTGLSATGEFLFGTPIKLVIKAFGGNPDVISGKAHRDYVTTKTQTEAYKAAQSVGDKYNISGGIIQNAITNLPNIALAIWTGGGSTVASLAGNPNGFISSLKSLAKNPMFWTSFAQSAGNDYEDAVEGGANTEVAALYSLLNSSLNAAVEVGGGIETLPGELKGVGTGKDAIIKWITSAVEEGKEEVVQSVITELNSRLLYDKSKITKDTLKEKGVSLVTEAGMGFLGGLFMGGGQMTFNAIVNAKSNEEYRQIGESAVTSDNFDLIIEYAKRSPEPEIRSMAESISSEKPDYKTAGLLYSYFCRDVETALSSADSIESATAGVRMIAEQAGGNNEIISGVVVPRYIETLQKLGADEATILQNILEFATQTETEAQVAEAGNDDFNLNSQLPNGQNSDAVTESETVKTGEISGGTQSGTKITSDRGLEERGAGEPLFREPSSQEIYRPWNREDYRTRALGGKANSKMKQIENLTEKLGMKLRWVDDLENGYYEKETNTIALNPTLTLSEAYVVVFKHEFCHRLETKQLYGKFFQYAYGKSKQFSDFCRQCYKEETGLDFDGTNADAVRWAVNDTYAFYKKNMPVNERGKVDEYYAKQELLADFVGDRLLGGQDIEGTLQALDELAQENRTVFDQLRDFIRELIAKIKGDPHYLTMEQDLEYLNKMVEQVYRSADIKTTAKDSGGVRYSAGKTFAQQVDDVISGTHNPRYDLYVSETPKLFTELGFTDTPLLMRNSKVNEILNKHSEMSVEIIKKIPDAIKKPILILKSKTHPAQSVVVITDVMTDKGEMIVPVWVNQEGNYLEVEIGEEFTDKTNFAASAYGRNIKALIEYANENEGFLYQSEDIEKVRQLLARNGLQLPTPLKISDSDITVPQNDTSVNTYSTQKSESYSEDVPERKYLLSRIYDRDWISKAEKLENAGERAESIWKHLHAMRKNGVWTTEFSDQSALFSPNGDVLKYKDPDYKEFLKFEEEINELGVLEKIADEKTLLTHEQQKTVDRYFELYDILEERYNPEFRKRRDPDYIRKQQLEEIERSFEVQEDKYGDPIYTTEQQAVVDEIADLEAILEKRYDLDAAPIKNYFYHDILFDLYPKAAEIRVIIDDLSKSDYDSFEKSQHGGYDSKNNIIVLDENYIKEKQKDNDKTALLKTMLHELQHAIQIYDGRATGSSVDFWKKVKEITGHLPYNKEKGREMTPEEAYWYTTGEDEAREMSSRHSMDDAERWRKMPKFETENAVIAEDYREKVDAAKASALSTVNAMQGEGMREDSDFSRGDNGFYEEVPERKYCLSRMHNKRWCAEAEKLEAAGKSREYIWEKLHVMRDILGNWITEISDSGARFCLGGDAIKQKDPDYSEFKKLSAVINGYGGIEKYKKGKLLLTKDQQQDFDRWFELKEMLDERYETEDYKMRDPDYVEFKRLGELIDSYEQPQEAEDGNFVFTKEQQEAIDRWNELKDILDERYRYDPKLLKNYLVHDKLFELFPQLSQVRLLFDDLSKSKYDNLQKDVLNGTVIGAYDSEINIIIIDINFLKGNSNNADAILEVVLHEIQHALQHYDERAAGSSVKFWEEIKKETGHLPYDKRYKREMTPKDAYKYTAGEIEARETEGRRWMSEAVRWDVMPDLEIDHAVIAEEYI